MIETEEHHKARLENKRRYFHDWVQEEGNKQKIWDMAKPAKDLPEQWLVIPAMDIIKLIEDSLTEQNE